MKKEIDILWEYENKESEFRDITDMLWLIYEDYYSLQENDLYIEADNYKRLRTFISNIHALLYKTTSEMENVIKKAYEYKRELNSTASK